MQDHNITRYEKEYLERKHNEGFETISMYKPNFIECDTIEKANQVNMNIYRLCERLSANMGKFIFVKRARK